MGSNVGQNLEGFFYIPYFILLYTLQEEITKSCDPIRHQNLTEQENQPA